METKLEREVRFLKVYAALTTLFCAGLFLSAFADQDKRPKFEEIDVERINIVEKDGKLRMVISNQERQHPGIANGKIINRDHPRPPGMIFFNHVGDEMGGFIFGDNGGNGHFGQLTFDKVRGDQAIGFRYLESDNGAYLTGLEIWQWPHPPSDVATSQPRLFLGKRRDDGAGLELSDMKGKPRILMQVAADGTPKLEFLDGAGKVIYSLPDSSGLAARPRNIGR